MGKKLKNQKKKLYKKVQKHKYTAGSIKTLLQKIVEHLFCCVFPNEQSNKTEEKCCHLLSRVLRPTWTIQHSSAPIALLYFDTVRAERCEVLVVAPTDVEKIIDRSQLRRTKQINSCGASGASCSHCCGCYHYCETTAHLVAQQGRMASSTQLEKLQFYSRSSSRA